MNLLALEFSSTHRSVALMEFDPSGNSRLLSSKTDSNFRQVNGMMLIDETLRSANVEPTHIEKLAVGLGPGSYTGIRSAIAIAQGWQLARPVSLLGVPTVDVLAWDAIKKNLQGDLSIIIDAQRGELYCARFNLTTEPRIMESLKICSLNEIDPASQVAGPDATRFIPSAIDLYPAATTLAEIAFRMTSSLPGEQLEPIYLRQTAFVKSATSPGGKSARP
jgi:tRNA threonylcarbamoyladenosine biosynthesis protein TsaB